MPKFEQKPNTGVLFANKDRKSDKHPQAKGSATIDGVEYWVSAWTNKAKSGERYQSLAFKPKDSQETDNPTQQRGDHQPIAEEDIPFSSDSFCGPLWRQ